MKLDGKILKEQREIMGISVAEMSRRSGLSRPTIYSYESMTDNTPIGKVLEAYMLEVLNHVLKVLNYKDRLDADDNYEHVKWIRIEDNEKSIN